MGARIETQTDNTSTASQCRGVKLCNERKDRMNTTSLIVIVYALLVIVGGLALLAAGWGISRGQVWGLQAALVLTLALLVFFIVRYIRTRAFMPGGLMAILSLLALVATWLSAHGH